MTTAKDLFAGLEVHCKYNRILTTNRPEPAFIKLASNLVAIYRFASAHVADLDYDALLDLVTRMHDASENFAGHIEMLLGDDQFELQNEAQKADLMQALQTISIIFSNIEELQNRLAKRTNDVDALIRLTVKMIDQAARAIEKVVMTIACIYFKTRNPGEDEKVAGLVAYLAGNTRSVFKSLTRPVCQLSA